MKHWLGRLFTRGKIALGEAQARDAGAIAALHGASFRRGWSEDEVEHLLRERNVTTHVARRGARIVGFIMSRRAAEESEILSVAVARAAQGRGIAGKLLDLHVRRLAGLGTRAIFLEVDERNEAAIRLYARAGFREVARRPNYYPSMNGKTANALVLRRDIG